MDAMSIAAILTPLAWPITILVLVFSFRSVLKQLMSRMVDALVIKTLKLKIFLAEIELTPAQAKNTLDQLFKDIEDSTGELSDPEIQLFKAIKDAYGRSTVGHLLPDFVHEESNESLRRLRVLRDRKLIRPFEGGPWRIEKHPVISRFGEIVWGMRDKALPNLKD
jgi:hypothetical protein